jgi:glycosyltransferase involved in cell wall biosynthesis
MENSLHEPGRTLSFVIPVYNEEGTLERLYSSIVDTAERLDLETGIIFVDDGSSDQSPRVLDALALADSRVSVLHFRRNYGKSAALDAGFRHATGSVVITIDADMQEDPRETPRFLAKLDEGFDVVSGWKCVRQDPIDKTLPSRFFNWLVGYVSGLHIHDFNCGFKAYRGESLKDLRVYGELHRYIPALLHWRGFKVTEIDIAHFPRTSGRSKFGFSRYFTGAFDLLTVVLTSKFRSRPLHFFGYIAVVFALIGSTTLVWLSALHFLGIERMHPRPLLYLAMLLILTAVLLLSTGLLGELIKSLHNASGPPDYLVRKVTGPLHSVHEVNPISRDRVNDGR